MSSKLEAADCYYFLLQRYRQILGACQQEWAQLLLIALSFFGTARQKRRQCLPKTPDQDNK
jgi:hypothetical protein